MQPSSLGYGSESDLAKVLISCGQVANSSFGVRRPAEARQFLRRQGSSPLRSEYGCGQRHRRRTLPPMRLGRCRGRPRGRANGRLVPGPRSDEDRTRIS